MPLLALIVLALVVPFLPLGDPNQQNLQSTLIPPVWNSGGSWANPLGTDALGRDVAIRMLWGLRLTLLIGGSAVLLSAVVGSIIGLLSGYLGGVTDQVLSRLIDAQLAIPVLLLAMAIITSQGQSVGTLIFALSVVGWARFARMMRGDAIHLRDRSFVLSMKVSGASPLRIMARHIFPNTSSTLIVVISIELGTMILTASALSFLGLGVSAPNISWGLMLAEGRIYMQSAYWLATFPGLAITAVVVLVGLTGRRLQMQLDLRGEGR